MTLARSWALGLLVLIPIAVALYLWIERRRRKFAVRYASLALIRDAQPGRLRWRRHVPFALLLLAVGALVVGFARPEMDRAVSRSDTSIILTLDVSRSMCSTDVQPNRLTAVQNAARRFVKDQPDAVRIGLVVFAGVAQEVVPPTRNTTELLRAIRSVTTSGGTAVGNAILTGIDAISDVNPQVAPSTVDLGSQGASKPGEGGFEPDIVVLLTDGASNRGVDPLTAADQAAARKVRVYTIGFGTDTPAPFVCTPSQIGTGFGAFGDPGGLRGGGFAGGPPNPDGTFNRQSQQAIDEKSLQAIADKTGAKYFRAQSAEQLQSVFRNLPSRVQVTHHQDEISVWFLALAALLVTMAVGASLYWNRYP
jgi:Ca-activated chloride channel family protein